MTRSQRCEAANRLLLFISQHGRCFLQHKGTVARFFLDDWRVWFVDYYSGMHIYTHAPLYRGWSGFTAGGTLQRMVKALAGWVHRGGEAPLGHFGPFPDWLCGGDPWAYGDDMALVRNKARELLS